MKMKSLAMLAISGLVASSFAYVTPAMADDNMALADNSQSTQTALGDNMQSSGLPSDMAANNTNNSTSTDEGTPDTASGSGDDDY